MIKVGYGNPASINESTSSKEYTILIQRKGKVREVTGTLNYLINYFGNTLETGIAYEDEKGSHKVSRYPKDINSLIKNLNYAKANSAMHGFDATRELYTLKKN